MNTREHPFGAPDQRARQDSQQPRHQGVSIAKTARELDKRMREPHPALVIPPEVTAAHLSNNSQQTIANTRRVSDAIEQVCAARDLAEGRLATANARLEQYEIAAEAMRGRLAGMEKELTAANNSRTRLMKTLEDIGLSAVNGMKSERQPEEAAPAEEIQLSDEDEARY